MQKRISALLLALALCCPAFTSAALAAEASEESLAYADLEQKVRSSNLTVLMIEETIASIDATDFDKMQDDLRKSLNNIAKAQLQATMMPDDTGAMSGTVFSSLQSSYDSLKDSFDDLRDGKIQDDAEETIRQLEDSEDQLVMGAETLYVAILEMQNQRTTLQNSLNAMERTLAEMETRYERGQISALTLAQVRNGRTQLKSGLDTLDLNIRNYTAQLQTMLGQDQTAPLTLGEVPEITAEQLAAMDLEKDLAQAKERSYTLYAAQNDLDDAKEDYEDTIRDYGRNRYQSQAAAHTYEAAKYTYQSTVQSFELSFRTTFSSVADYQQILEASEDALDYQEGEYASAQAKYNQGNISKNELLDAKDDLDEAAAAVTTAKHNLFSAYRTYWWAVEQGVLN